MTTYERFMLKVNVHSGNACWNWAGARSGSGYGQFWDGTRTIPAHWFLLEKRPPKDKEACHHCDNKLCVRPSHIFIGSRSDNMRDMVSKGRHNVESLRRNCLEMLKVRRLNIGEENHNSKLNGEDVAFIRAIGKGYGRGVRLARMFNVSGAVISGIWNKKRWPQVIPDSTALKRAKKWTDTDPKAREGG